MVTNNHCLGRISGRFVSLREVTVDDAAYILALRTSEKGQMFLHYTDPDLNKQIDYIKRYLGKNDEWYFIIENNEGKSIGCIGIYDVNEESAVTGRWIMEDLKDPRPAIECKLLINDFIYYTLGLANIRTDTKVTNVGMQSMFRLWGCEEIARKDDIIYYNLPRLTYEKNKAKIARFCK